MKTYKVTLQFSQDMCASDDEELETVEYTFTQQDLEKLSLPELASHLAHANLIYEGYLPNMDTHQEPVVEES